MKTNQTKLTQILTSLTLTVLCGMVTIRASGEIVEKLADFAVGSSVNTGYGYGPSTPYTKFSLIGSNLWFTTSAGGANGLGGVFYFDPSSSNVVQVVPGVNPSYLDNNSGTAPWASTIVVANGLGWFTTSTKGAGNKGSICSIDLISGAVNNVYSFSTNSAYGQSPHSTPIQIGQELWFTCSAGGAGGSTFGTVSKYNLTNGTVTDVFGLTGTNGLYPGRQPLGSSLVPAGSNTYYFLTFAGGTNVNSSYPNGAGTLQRVSFDGAGNPTLTKVADMSGYLGFPGGDPVYDGTNYLYFGTTGANATPGGIGRYDIRSNLLTSIYNFVSNAVSATNFGKQVYTSPVFYKNKLYFPTFTGGTQNKGALDVLDLTSNIVTKLADLEGSTGLALGGQSQYCGGTIYTNPVTGSVGVYFPLTKGGVNNVGSIVRVVIPPPPIVAKYSPNNSGNLSWVGGYGPFNVDYSTDLQSGWTTNWVSGLLTNSIVVPPTNTTGYFRVSGAIE